METPSALTTRLFWSFPLSERPKRTLSADPSPSLHFRQTLHVETAEEHAKGKRPDFGAHQHSGAFQHVRSPLLHQDTVTADGSYGTGPMTGHNL